MLLVVDDDQRMSSLVATTAQEMRFETLTINSAAALLKILPTVEVDGIVMDIVMPGMDGIELLRHLSAQKCRVPIILMSGFNPMYMRMADTIGSGDHLNIVATLQKPFEIETLESALRLLERQTASAQTTEMPNDK
jgi:DNA-binding response OmpR family regulator